MTYVSVYTVINEKTNISVNVPNKTLRLDNVNIVFNLEDPSKLEELACEVKRLLESYRVNVAEDLLEQTL